MIHLSKLLRGGEYLGDAARFPERGPTPPVVVWHMTDACNLRCRHCYAAGAFPPAMEHEEALAFLEFLAAEVRPSSLLLSGGEPLARRRFFELLDRAVSLGLRVSLSTNGTLIDARAARFLKERGVGYVGVSFDGTSALHDGFRNVEVAFAKALAGVRELRSAGCRVGLRFTMVRPLLSALPDILRLAEDEGFDRACFYHFVPSGRGRGQEEFIPTRGEARAVLERLCAWTEGGTAPGEVLTVGNFADGLWLYLRLKERGDARAESLLSLIGRGGGGRSGRGIVSVRWDGSLFADQFSWDRPLGRWADIGTPKGTAGSESAGIEALGGRCGRCRWSPLCRGNLRARAAALTGDPAGEDPGCVLEDWEIER